jgi:hypothetical protein
MLFIALRVAAFVGCRMRQEVRPPHEFPAV